MDVFFRTDSSVSIGTGHVYRCLTLADKFQQAGLRVTFICADHEGHPGDMIRARGHNLCLIPASLSPLVQLDDAHPGQTLNDADILVDAANSLACWHETSIVIVDHYQLDARWESFVRPRCSLLVAIDDLANRAHDCDLLIDQNLGRETEDYAHWVPAGTLVLTGPGYALLRPEFSAFREASLGRNSERPLKRVVINFGGTDPSNLSGETLDFLSRFPAIQQLELVVILGKCAPMASNVAAQISSMPCAVELIVNPPSMAEVLAQCDLAIGAAGGSAWERCCLGLPSIVVIQAENQRSGAMALQAAGAARVIAPDQWNEQRLFDALNDVSKPEYRQALAAASASLVDGGGAGLVATLIKHWKHTGSAQTCSITAGDAILRPMRSDDLLTVWQWRNHPAIRQHMTHSEVIPLEHHIRWFVAAQSNQRKTLLVLEVEREPLGFMQFDQLADTQCYEWGFYTSPLAPTGSGTVLGAAAIRYAFELLGAETITAKVLAQNHRSRSFHKKLAFTDVEIEEKHDGYSHFELNRATWQTKTGTFAS